MDRIERIASIRPVQATQTRDTLPVERSYIAPTMSIFPGVFVFAIGVLARGAANRGVLLAIVKVP
jgi:hypothetical protein